MAPKSLLLVLAAGLAGGIYLPANLSAQPSQPRHATWRGTNADGNILTIKEDNSNPHRSPRLSGVYRNRSGVHVLENARFDYSDNRFRAQWIHRGQTNQIELHYQSGSENGTALAQWGGDLVLFVERRKK